MTPLAVVRSYDDLHNALRARADELALQRLAIDEIAGLPSGYSAKVLAPVPIKGIGRISLGPMLGALGLMLLVVEDAESLRRFAHRAKPKADAGRTMPAMRKRKKRAVCVFTGNSALGKMARARQILLTSSRDRTRLARHAATIRWAKVRAAAKPAAQASGQARSSRS